MKKLECSPISNDKNIIQVADPVPLHFVLSWSCGKFYMLWITKFGTSKLEDIRVFSIMDEIVFEVDLGIPKLKKIDNLKIEQ